MDERVIELNLREINQLFNSMDPAPFREKDLDHDAEEFITGSAQEHPAQAPLRLRVHLRQPAAKDTEIIRQAVHHYFKYRADISRMDLRRLLRQGRANLLIGLLFLAACLFISHWMLPQEGPPWTAVLRESLTIMGWVAMWRPIQIYLYDWWPIRQQTHVYEKLSAMPVEVLKAQPGEKML